MIAWAYLSEFIGQIIMSIVNVPISNNLISNEHRS